MSASKLGGSSQSLLDTGNLSSSKSDSASAGGKESKEKDNSSSGGAPERPSSPESVKCAICLGDVVNRSCSNSCAHQFCFGCLLEWSKVKPECPLCKSSFRSIYHNFRSTTEYDEYTVPAPAVPHLSIRFTASAGGNYRLSPFIRVLEARAAQLSPVSHMSHHQESGVAVASLASLFRAPTTSLSSLMMTNPFNNGSSSSAFRAEYFGDILSNDLRSHEDTSQMRGYQNRRRRYDRSEWVQPFGSTLQPGSVIFPSVDYIRSHPSAAGRLRSWLYRELNVLMGIHRNRDQMSFIYDLIMHLLSHYDIRSRDFRESISSYLGSRTSHFQHELYHFLLSGMGMEEYDRVAEYPSASNTSSRSTVNSTATAQPPPRNTTPEIITLDSDDEERNPDPEPIITLPSSRAQEDSNMDDVIVVESSSSDDDDNLVYRGYQLLSSLRHLRGESGGARRSSTVADTDTSGRRYEESANRSSSRNFGNNAAVPDLSSILVQEEQEQDNLLLRPSSSRIFDSDPEMPVLEPQVFSFIPVDNYAPPTASNSNPFSGRSRSNMTTAIDRSRATAATATVSTDHNITVSSVASPESPSPELISQTLTRSHHDSNLESLGYMDAEFDLDLNVSVEPYSSPPPAEPPRSMRSPDFPILQFRELRRRERDPRLRYGRSCIADYMSNHPPTSSRTTEGGSAFVAYEPDISYPPSSREELCRPPRPSCSYDTSNNSSSYLPSASSSRGGRYRATSPSPAFRIDLYPHGMSSSQVMDLSRSAGLIPSSSSAPSRSLLSTSTGREARPLFPASSGLNLSPLNLAAATASTSSKRVEAPEAADNVEVDSDELECLGSFPIEKKPPLAVITISSDDEDDSAIKAERNDDMLNILSSDDEAALLDGFMNWRSNTAPTEFNLLEAVTPPLPDTDIYCVSHSSSSSDFLPESSMPVASSSRSAVSNSAAPSTSSATTRSKRLSTNLTNLVQSLEAAKKRKSDPVVAVVNDSPRSKKHSYPSTSLKSPPKKRSKRLQISSSSEDDDNDDNDINNSHPSSSQPVTRRSSARVRIPKKRMFVEVPSTPSPPSAIYSSSEDSESSSNDDEDLIDVMSSNRGSKKRGASASPRKKHKLKSKKSKKSKKHKSKEKKRSSRSVSGSAKHEKSKTSEDSSADADYGTGKGTTSTITRHSSGRSKSKEGKHTATASSSSSKSTGGLLDLSFSSRNDDNMPLLFHHGNEEETDTIDLRVPPAQPDPASSSSALSTVDPSAIFGHWF